MLTDLTFLLGIGLLAAAFYETIRIEVLRRHSARLSRHAATASLRMPACQAKAKAA